jgi:hypothetical protein
LVAQLPNIEDTGQRPADPTHNERSQADLADRDARSLGGPLVAADSPDVTSDPGGCDDVDGDDHQHDQQDQD